MKQVKNTLEFSAQRLATMCEEEKIETCAVITTLKNADQVVSFCKALCEKMTQNGRNAVFGDSAAVDTEVNVEPGTLRLALLPRPDQNMNALRVCQEWDGVVLVERYGVTHHKALDEMVELLREQKVNLLGVIGLKD